MKLTIEIELQPKEEQLLIDKINEFCNDWFNKKPVLQQTTCTTQLSCGCKKGQRGMITFAKDGDYCGNCGKLIPTT